MIKELTIKNFRSIREASLELGRFTVLTGANNSGKSSVLYALQVLKNVVTNPNRSWEDLLNLGFLNLGGLKEVYFMKKTNAEFLIEVTVEEEEVESKFGLFSDEIGVTCLTITGVTPYEFYRQKPVSFPYVPGAEVEVKIKKSKEAYFLWDGFKPTNFSFQIDSPQKEKLWWGIQSEVENPIAFLFSLDVTPTLRGFSKYHFNIIPLSSQSITEEQVATLLAIDKTLQAKVAHYFEKITGKRFSVSMGPGGGFFYLQVREPDTPFTTELVNQGMGVNQILFLLAKILYDKNRLICIDEPEIHLHPTLIEQFVKVLVEIAEKEDKQFIFSTHSEHWLMSMLAEVNDENLKADDLKVYYLYKEGQETKIEGQKVYPNGQLEGGLRNFLDAEMRLSERFLSV